MLARTILCAGAASAVLLLHGCGSDSGSSSDAGYTCEGTTTAENVTSDFNLSGKVVIVTGGDGGLGFPAVRAFAKQGAAVVIASRNLTKCQRIARKVAADVGGNVTGMHLDLASFSSIHTFVKQFLGNFSRLDVLINNAGIADNPQHKSKDGFQLLFAVNYLGPFLLTELLLPSLRSSGSASHPARVVNVASSEHKIACEAAGWKKGCLKDFQHFPPPVLKDRNVTIHYDDGKVVTRSIELYGFTKLLSIEHAIELSHRESPSIKAFSLTPGWVNDSLGVWPGIPPTQIKEKCDLQGPGNPCPFTPEEGAAISAFCALRGTQAGGYYSRIKGCRTDTIEGNGFQSSMGLELYKRSLNLTGLSQVRESMTLVV